MTKRKRPLRPKPRYLRPALVRHGNLRALELAAGTGTSVAGAGLLGDQPFLILVSPGDGVR